MSKLVENFKSIVAEKKERFANKGAVYAGNLVDGKWVPESLADVYPEFGKVVEFPEYGEGWEPKPVIDGMEFIGGTMRRGFYMDMSVLESYEGLYGWFQEKGDPHLLASMFLRPGKTARHALSISFPSLRYTEGENDGTLFRLDEVAWKAFLQAYELPEQARWAQVTFFNPHGVLAKGSVRLCLPGEEPALYTDSFKWLLDDVTAFDTRQMSILTVDFVYRPRPSLGRQEYTHAKYHGASLNDWVIEDIKSEAHAITAGLRYSPDNMAGFMQAQGFPVPDTVMEGVKKGQRDSLQNLLSKWKLSRDSGWRGKVAASELVGEGEIMLPRECEPKVQEGTVWVGRNPFLPKNGFVTYKVVGFHDGNFMVVNHQDNTWNNVLGGDWDGDDGIVLYRPPFKNYAYKHRVNLQEFKSSHRAMSASTPEERIERWVKEANAPIGQFDMLARYAIDLGKADETLLMDVTKAVQFAISLKKRDGDIQDYVTSRMEEVRKGVGRMREATETYYMRNYAELLEEERVIYRHVVKDEMMTVLETVEAGLEQVKDTKPRFTLNALEDMFAKLTFDGPLLEKAREFAVKRAALIAAMQTADDNEDMQASYINTQLRYLQQVEMPEYALSLSEEEWAEFSACLWYLRPRDTLFWLWSVHPGWMMSALKATYAKEKPMLIAKDGHSLEEGDKVIIRPFQREARGEDGTILTLSGGIVGNTELLVATVEKAYAKSVVVRLEPAA